MALYGLVQIIQGHSAAGLTLIIGGAVVTLLPNLIESFMGGLNGIMNSTGLGGTKEGFKPEGCANESSGSSGSQPYKDVF